MLNFEFCDKKILTCESLISIPHICEEPVRLFLGCEEFVPTPHTCAQLVPISRICEEVVGIFKHVNN